MLHSITTISVLLSLFPVGILSVTTLMVPLNPRTTASPCACPSLFVTAPASLRDVVGMYALHSCRYAEHDVYVNADMSTYLFYNETSTKWVFAPELGASASSSIESVSTGDTPSGISWQVFDNSAWTAVDTVSVECACNQHVCMEVMVNSTVLGHTFKGTFNMSETRDERPVFWNAEEQLYLYFHSAGDCHFWAISDSLTSSQWVMYSYDISPRPTNVKAAWNVRTSSGWVEDEDLKVVCVDK
ncbi:hypothetical protein CAPTEDRAFT_227320 [Capitella teleta]|uniref:Uncharacterized protein n=1 Tax=Capitella teleta TaxID=283909 RepID=R7V1F8_CAPTE|nr:hypothetical protein CAPTEDRAFT_227320 [Capitella teleta]|eukprot:ELU12389.1 hypothetical protein CAPTEDRAFT_227320 [Capitella teleta]